MSKKKVLVTGLNGVVGSAIRPLFEEKYDLSQYETIFVPPAIDSHQDHRKLNSV